MAAQATSAPAPKPKGFKPGVAATWGIAIISVLLIVIACIWLFGGKKKVASTDAPAVSVVQKPIDVPTLGPVVKSFTDADCGKSFEVALSFGERATFSGMCPIIGADVTDGAMLFRYQNGRTHLIMPYATSPIRDSAVISVTGASTIKASYKVKFGSLLNQK